MKSDVWRRFLDKLANADVRVRDGSEGGIGTPETSSITEEEEKELSSLAKTRMLGGFFRCVWSDFLNFGVGGSQHEAPRCVLPY